MRQQTSTAALRRGLRAIGAFAAVIAGPAMAQSSVTLYGVADVGVVFESGNAKGHYRPVKRDQPRRFASTGAA
jgi:predicted porin